LLTSLEDAHLHSREGQHEKKSFLQKQW